MILPFLASLAVSGSVAAAELPDVPSRTELWNTKAFERSIASAPVAGDPVDAMLNGKTPEERGRGVLRTRDSFDYKQADGAAFWRSINLGIDALGLILDNPVEDPSFRRFSIALVFGGGLYPHAKERIQLHPLEPGGLAAWKRLAGLRDRCLQDPDPRLNEFFERYRHDRAAANWKRAKAESRALDKRLVRKFPEQRKSLKAFWSEMQKTEDKELRGYKDYPAIQGLKKLPKKSQVRLKAAIRLTYDSRLYTAWGSFYRHSLIEALGQEAADEAGVKVLPVKLGWPDFDFLASRKR